MPPARRLVRAAGLSMAAGVLLAGCMGVGERRDLPSWSPGPAIPAGVAQGTLRWDGTCVRLETEDGPSWVVVWPEGTRLRDDIVPPMVVDSGDRVLGSLGDRVSLAGVAYPAGSWELVRDQLIEDIPRLCRDEAFWLGVMLRG